MSGYGTKTPQKCGSLRLTPRWHTLNVFRAASFRHQTRAETVALWKVCYYEQPRSQGFSLAKGDGWEKGEALGTRLHHKDNADKPSEPANKLLQKI